MLPRTSNIRGGIPLKLHELHDTLDWLENLGFAEAELVPRFEQSLRAIATAVGPNCSVPGQATRSLSSDAVYDGDDLESFIDEHVWAATAAG
jgi:hypothetical protein